MRSEVFIRKLQAVSYALRAILDPQLDARSSWPQTGRSLLFRRQRQSEHGFHALARHVHFGVDGIRQIQSLAMLAAVNFRVASPGFFRVAASFFNHVFRIEPAFQMAAAEFALLVFLIAGALTRLLDFDFMMRKLRRSLRR